MYIPQMRRSTRQKAPKRKWSPSPTATTVQPEATVAAPDNALIGPSVSSAASSAPLYSSTSTSTTVSSRFPPGPSLHAAPPSIASDSTDSTGALCVPSHS